MPSLQTQCKWAGATLLFFFSSSAKLYNAGDQFIERKEHDVKYSQRPFRSTQLRASFGFFNKFERLQVDCESVAGSACAGMPS